MIRGDEDIFSIMDEMSPDPLSLSLSSSKKVLSAPGLPVTDSTIDDATNVSGSGTNSGTNGGTNGSISGMKRTQIRLIPEVEGYGDMYVISTVDNGPKGDIWNPYVAVSISTADDSIATTAAAATAVPNNKSLLLIPTNPDVEVARRRSYEKFKTKFYTAFEWIVGKNRKNNPNNNNGNNNGNKDDNDDNNGKNYNKNEPNWNEYWKYTPPHNILERFHFASKLEESIRVINAQTNDNHNNNNNTATATTTAITTANTTSSSLGLDQNTNINDIRISYINGKENGTIMDPILLSTSFFYQNDNNNKNKSKSQSQSQSNNNIHMSKGKNDLQLLKNEIMFQFSREWKKANKKKNIDNNNDDNHNSPLNQYFTTPVFQRKCTKIKNEIHSLSLEVEREFMVQISKKAIEMSSSTANNSNHHSRKKKNSKRKGVPKLSIQQQRHSSSTVTATATNTNNKRNSNNDDNNDNDTQNDDVMDVMAITYSGLSFRISLQHFQKLQILYDRNNTNHTTVLQHQDNFYKALFTVLCRYDMLEGGGLQSALNGNVFDVLLNKLHCNMECFASPFNCRYERYCSAFPDTDMFFGSMGSFFDFQFEGLKDGGCFQANPPFAADFILAMYRRMEKLLMDDTLDAPFMFIVFIPAWNYSTGWQALSQSTVLTKSILLSQKDDPHYYCEGTQHRRLKERYRVASFDTSVFFLQNDAAKEKWPVTDDILNEVRVAFATNPDEEQVKKVQLPLKSQRTKKRKKVVDKVNTDNEGKPKDKQSKNKNKPMDVDDNGNDNSRGRSNSRIHQQSKKNRKKNIDKSKKAPRNKKTLVDDSSKQFDILSSIGILESKEKSKSNKREVSVFPTVNTSTKEKKQQFAKRKKTRRK